VFLNNLKSMNQPITSITDFILCAESLFFGLWIISCAPKEQSLLWGSFFLFLTLGALLGGLYHGFSWADTNFMQRFINLSLIVALTVFPLAILSLKLSPIPPWVYYLTVFILLIAITALFNSTKFLHVILYEGGALLVSFCIVLYYFKSGDKEAASLLLAGLVLSVIGALIQSLKFKLLPFSHNDLFHIVQMFSLVFFFFAWKVTNE
jgi:hypothetical protein